MADRAATRSGDPPAADKPMLRVPGLAYGALDDLLGYALRLAQNALYIDFARATARFDITPQRFAALVLIAENPGLRQGLLAQAMGIDRSGALKLVAWLQERGLVDRIGSRSDARSRLLKLTAAGRELVDAMTPVVRAHDRRMGARVGADALLLKELLERIAAPE